jgi:cysteine desulfurase/selenocysteine lyase
MSSILKQREQKAGLTWPEVRRDFPILDHPVHGRPLVYLDNGATTQKPRAVIEATSKYYEQQNANIHRGNYQLSVAATAAYEAAREKVARFINAAEPAECLFTKGTTEAINLVASSLGRLLLRAGDDVIISAMEHHSNIVPWQLACEYFGAQLKVIPVNDVGELRYEELEQLLSPRTKIVAVTHLSNVLGTINEVKRITKLAHAVGAVVLIDGAQWVAHQVTDVQKLDCDFYAFSSHKMYGPTGVGVLYGKRAWLDRMPPYQGGGDMIKEVTFAQTTYAELPNKFEAGTPNMAGVAGLSAAIDYLQHLGLNRIHHYEEALTSYALQRLGEVPGLQLLGNAKERGSVISFVMEKPSLAALDVGLQLDRRGIAVRVGHHCCMPLHERLGVTATTRVSLGVYNTSAEIDALVAALHDIRSKAGTSAPRTAPRSDEIQFASASATSPNEAAEELADVFDFLPDKMAKAEQIEDYARELPPQFEQLKKLTDRLAGCQSQVYLISRRVPGSPDRLEFAADADATIVRGEIAMLQKLFSGQKASDILAFDVNHFFSRIGFEHFLTQQRRTGLASMIDRIRQLAQAISRP